MTSAHSFNSPLKIIHLIDDNRVGGVTGILDNLSALNKNQTYHFNVLNVDTDFKIAPKMDADIIVIHFTLNWKKLLFLISLRLQLRNQKIIINEHSYTKAYQQIFVKNKFRFHTLLRISYKLADLVIAVSENQRDWILKDRLCSKHKLDYIQQYKNWPELEKIPLIERKLDKPLKLLAFGRFHRQKGFDIALQAMSYISPECAELTLAGYGEEEAVYKRFAKNHPHIYFSAKFKTPKVLLEKHDAVLIPSRWEAFGQIAVEARAAGRVIIASDVDGLSEQIKSVGFLVPPEDPKALADAIIKLVKIKDFKTLGVKARKSIKGGYQNWINRWCEIYDRFSV